MEFYLRLLYLVGQHVFIEYLLCARAQDLKTVCGHILTPFKISSVCTLTPSSFQSQCLRPGLEMDRALTYLGQMWGLAHPQQQLVLRKKHNSSDPCYWLGGSRPSEIPCLQVAFHLVNYEAMAWRASEAPSVKTTEKRLNEWSSLGSDILNTKKACFNAFCLRWVLSIWLWAKFPQPAFFFFHNSIVSTPVKTRAGEPEAGGLYGIPTISEPCNLKPVIEPLGVSVCSSEKWGK